MIKFFRNPLVIPLCILLVSAVIGGLPPIAIKVALRELPSPMIMFLRVSIMLPIFFLISGKHLGLLRTHWRSILPIALGWAGNMLMFSLGIPHTNAAVSQVMYTAVPVIVAALSPVVLKEIPTGYQMVGIGVGVIGTLVTIFGDGSGFSGGNTRGNILVMCAVISWALYVIATRKFKTHVPAGLNLFVGALIAWVGFAGMVWVSPTGFYLPDISPATVYAVLFLALIGGVIMFFAHLWGAQRVPAVISGSTGYVSVMAAIVGSWVVLGEHLARHEWYGFVLLVIAVMLTTTIPLLIRHVKK